ncbi:OmpA domain-containing protein [Actibacterium atlanticum]|uniref:OmpA domain-containing protein n=1 Tax=Actibacterium atlanticum TaxID=1461693 RepID=A0A058ZIZ6_9RHOB|nr:OmpA family protein [Actibacterium atlanticum]KCV81162.1 OmpA domain-containing protein [Actibacterium atlanticum]
MNTLLGGVVFVVGVGGLSLWGAYDHARDMEAEVTSAAAQAVSSAKHGVDTQVSGRDIIATGIADTEAERNDLLAALNDIQGRRVVVNRIAVLPMAAPFAFGAERADGVTSLSGNVPSEVDRDALSGADGATALALASGAPNGWATAAQSAIDALAPLQDGAAMISDTDMVLKGTAATPAEHDAALAALAALPEGFQSSAMIDIVDDGNPDFTVDFDAASLTRVSGKLPKGVVLGDIAGALGISGITGDAFSSFGEDADALASFGGLADWLGQFDLLRLTRSAGQTSINGQVLPGADLELIQQGMAESLPGVEITLTESTREVSEGDERLNSQTAQTERYSSGFWLPVVAFDPSPDTCDVQASSVLSETQINFVTGSARLDARALHGVNALAAVVRPCVGEAGLTLELGGHTDSTGDAAANQALSALRAEAVRQALIARGVAQSAMRAQGYGADQPIASNETEAGRAANRRTTVIWSD